VVLEISSQTDRQTDMLIAIQQNATYESGDLSNKCISIYFDVAKMNSTAVPITKMMLKTMKQMRSMTAAAIIHSLIIC